MTGAVSCGSAGQMAQLSAPPAASCAASAWRAGGMVGVAAEAGLGAVTGTMGLQSGVMWHDGAAAAAAAASCACLPVLPLYGV